MNKNEYYEGQRIYYTGRTSYRERVQDELATIERIYEPLHSLDIVFDRNRKITNEVIPKEQRAFVTPADLVLNLVSITPA